MKNNFKILLAISSGLILSLGWYEWGSGLFLLIGFLPLLFLEEQITNDPLVKSGGLVFRYAFLCFLIWNLATTWWIYNASFGGMLTALILTSTFMTLPFWIYSITKRRLGRYMGYASLIVYWLTYEYWYTYGEVSWPWLCLGNGFMFSHRLIQWYEITGSFGGSLWVLLVNVLLFETIRQQKQGIAKKKINWLLLLVSILIIVPISLSLLRYYTYQEKGITRNILVVQPNIDPYLKFNDIPALEQTAIQVNLAAKNIKPETDYVVGPETSIMDNIWLDHLMEVPDMKMVKNLVDQQPGLNFISGIMCYQQYTEANRSITSNPLGENTGYWFDSFNSAFQIDSTNKVQIYHKSQLVVGVEKMPYPAILSFLKKLTLKLGGTFRSHGSQRERDVFRSTDDSIAVAPVICYESVYGEYVTGYVHKGANFIFVITNDGWWGNTPGHRQHNALSSLRAIENRRSVARSANTGISSFINQRGDVLQKITWWKRGTIEQTLKANNELTFYVKHGDFIVRIAMYLAFAILLLMLIRTFQHKKKPA